MSCCAGGEIRQGLKILAPLRFRRRGLRDITWAAQCVGYAKRRGVFIVWFICLANDAPFVQLPNSLFAVRALLYGIII